MQIGRFDISAAFALIENTFIVAYQTKSECNIPCITHNPNIPNIIEHL